MSLPLTKFSPPNNGQEQVSRLNPCSSILTHDVLQGRYGEQWMQEGQEDLFERIAFTY